MNKINIGDRFLLKDNKTIVEVIIVNKYSFHINSINYPILFENNIGHTNWVYNTLDLTFCRHVDHYQKYKHLDIKCKFPSLKEKINLL